MHNNNNSEYRNLNTVLMRSPLYAFVDENKISQEWETLNYLGAPDFEKSVTEHQILTDFLKGNNVNVLQLDSESQSLSMDSLYARDASIATSHGMILCEMGKDARKGEPGIQKRYFQENGIKVLGEITSPGKIEGGDVAWIRNDLLAVGRGYRTNNDGINQLRTLISDFADVLVVDLPHFRGPDDVFHLMSIISPVDEKKAVVYSKLMPVSFREFLLDEGYLFVEVPDEEYDSIGCNVLAYGPSKCIIARGNPITTQRMRDVGIEVMEYDGEEISLKGCGGPTCLTRPIIRE